MVIDDDLRNSSNNILVHHGVEGQKWGQQNGPPYPLDPNKDYSKRELKAYKRQLRKEYRKEVKRRKKYIKKYKKEEEERLKFEEAKKKAIQSGSPSEVEKYKDKMTNEELKEAMDRIDAVQAFEKTKVNALKMSNDKIKEELNKITYENNLKAEELKKAYGPGKGEAILDKAGRISDNIGKLASNTTKVLTALSTAQIVREKKFKNDKNERDDKETRFIDSVINSGDEALINKHLNKMSNEQAKKAMDRLEMLDPARERINQIVASGDANMIKRYYKQMSNDQINESLDRIELLTGNRPVLFP